MYLLRPITRHDLEQLYELSAQTMTGLTTLPHDRAILEKKIKQSVRSFESMPDKPSGEVYLFVLEDMVRKRIVGTSAIYSKVGGFEPSYTYKIQTITTASKPLNVKKEIQYLQLLADHNGPSEIGTLFLDPQYRNTGLGRFLSLVRFLFMAQYRPCFEDEVMVEMRGVIDEKDFSPFWEALGKHFFDVEFKKADLMVTKDKRFIADLMPKHPIYIPILPKEAQAVIGQTQESTKPALRLLEQEGFVYKDEIDIFEAGPVLRARLDQIRSVKESQEAVFTKVLENDSPKSDYMIARVDSFADFKATIGDVVSEGSGQIQVSKEAADILKLTKGNKVRFSSLRPQKMK